MSAQNRKNKLHSTPSHTPCRTPSEEALDDLHGNSRQMLFTDVNPYLIGSPHPHMAFSLPAHAKHPSTFLRPRSDTASTDERIPYLAAEQHPHMAFSLPAHAKHPSIFLRPRSDTATTDERIPYLAAEQHPHTAFSLPAHAKHPSTFLRPRSDTAPTAPNGYHTAHSFNQKSLPSTPYSVLPLSESMYDIRMIDDIDQEAVGVREAWIRAQPTLKKQVTESGTITYFERFDEKTYWQLYDTSYLAFTQSWHSLVAKKILLKQSLKYIDTAIALQPGIWFSYHLKYKIYCASGKAQKATDTMLKLEEVLECQGLVYELLNICYATKIYADLEKGNLESAAKHIHEAKLAEAKLTSASFEMLDHNPFSIVQKQYESIKHGMNRTPSSGSEPEEDIAPQAPSFSGAFIRACDIFSGTLAKARMQHSIDDLQRDVNATKGQVAGLELKISKLETSINKAFKIINQKTVDLEDYLRSIDANMHNNVIEYSKAYVLTMMRTFAISMTLISDEVKMDTDNFFKSATIGLFGLIPFCGSTVGKIFDASITALQTHNIRENSAKMVRMVSNEADMYYICKEVLRNIVTDTEKLSEIINEKSVQKAGFFQKIYEKINAARDSLEGRNVYTTYATKLAYHDAINSIKEGLKIYGQATESTVFSSSKNVVDLFLITILHKDISKDMSLLSTTFSSEDDESTPNTTTTTTSTEDIPSVVIGEVQASGSHRGDIDFSALNSTLV